MVVASTKSDQRIEAGLRDLDDVEDQEKIEKERIDNWTNYFFCLFGNKPPDKNVLGPKKI